METRTTEICSTLRTPFSNLLYCKGNVVRFPIMLENNPLCHKPKKINKFEPVLRKQNTLTTYPPYCQIKGNLH